MSYRLSREIIEEYLTGIGLDIINYPASFVGGLGRFSGRSPMVPVFIQLCIRFNARPALVRFLFGMVIVTHKT